MPGDTYPTKDEVDVIRRNKARRADFDQVSLSEVHEYTELELRKLSAAATVLRDGFNYMDIRMNSWSGAGAAAAALYQHYGVPKHYAGWVKKRKISHEQETAHACYYGGHIELIKQGYTEVRHYSYDIRSAYPSEMIDLPSMIGAKVRRYEDGVSWEKVEQASKISKFLIRWRLPIFYVNQEGRLRNIPFFPLPYRLPGGGILFPSEGSGWYMRDDALAAKKWLETFWRLSCGMLGVTPLGYGADIPAKAARVMETMQIPGVVEVTRQKRFASPSKPDKWHGLNLMICEAEIYAIDAKQPKPFAWIGELFAERARIKREEPGNVAEQNIKLSLNSLSGKAAQSVGGSDDEPPATVCPWYAAATTAGTRRRVMEAALQNPHAIVQFSTDGIVSLEPLDLPIGDGLGQWEADELICDLQGRGALYALSGVYTNYPESEGKDTTKTRGMSPGNIVRATSATIRDLLLGKFRPAWQMPCDPADPATWPRVEFSALK